MSPIRRVPGLRPLRTAAGALAVAGSVALLSPGVTLSPRPARAEPASPSLPADGPACRAGANAEALTVDLEHWIAMVQAGAVANQPADDTEVVVLDNRGHNYRPDPARPPALLDLERRLR